MDFSGIISLVVTILGLLFALFLYLREKRNSKIQYLSKQIICFYITEKYYLKELVKKNEIIAVSKISNTNFSSLKEDQLKKDIRGLARKDPDFPADTSIFETADRVKKFLYCE